MAGTREGGSDFKEPDESKDSMGYDTDSQLRGMEARRQEALGKEIASRANDGEENGAGHDAAMQRVTAWEYLMKRYKEANGMEADDL